MMSELHAAMARHRLGEGYRRARRRSRLRFLVGSGGQRGRANFSTGIIKLKPPSSPGRDAELIFNVIRSQPGRTIAELSCSTGFWTHELLSTTCLLYDQRLIEHRDGGRLFVREKRKKKVEQAPGRWAHLKAFFRGR